MVVVVWPKYDCEPKPVVGELPSESVCFTPTAALLIYFVLGELDSPAWNRITE